MRDEETGIIRMARGQAVGILIVCVLISALLTFGFANVYLSTPAQPEAYGDSLTEADNYEELLRTVELILSNYIHADDIAVEQLVEGAIRGAMQAVGDPYSMYFDASALREFRRETVEGEYSGIGASILDVQGYVTILVPFENSPAATTPYEGAKEDTPVGLRSGDRILRVDGVDVVGMSAEFVAEMIRGPVGEVVTVEVERPGNGGASRTLVFHIERDNIEIPTVRSEVLDDDIGMLVISRFTGRTPEQVRYHLQALEDAGVTGIILDLRNNPGGTLDECVEVASIFLPAGPVVRTVDRDGDVEVREVAGPEYPLPLVVLVNEFSASASEIIAGAMRDRMDVPLVGMKTFGKGSVQRLYYLDPDKPSGMKLTTERYLTPDGYSIEEEGGLQPDIEVEWPEDAIMGDPEHDPQLRRAMEILRDKQD